MIFIAPLFLIVERYEYYILLIVAIYFIIRLCLGLIYKDTFFNLYPARLFILGACFLVAGSYFAWKSKLRLLGTFWDVELWGLVFLYPVGVSILLDGGFAFLRNLFVKWENKFWDNYRKKHNIDANEK